MHVELLDEQTKEQKRFFFWQVGKRVWITSLIASILLLLLLILLLLIFVVGRAIAQSAADNVHVTLNYVDIVGPPATADGRSLQVELSVHTSYHARADSDIKKTNAKLSFQDSDIGIASLPARKLKKGVQDYDIIIETSMDVTNVAGLASMSSELINRKEIFVTGDADLDVKAWGIRYPGIDFRRTFRVAGMNENREPPPKVNSIVLEECKSGGYTFEINATIDNVSQLGLRNIGVLNMSVYYETENVGYALSKLPRLGLPRGKSNQSFQMIMPDTFSSKRTFLKMMRGIMSHHAQFYIVGKNPFVSTTMLLREALQDFNLSVLHTDGMDNVRINPQCTLVSLLGRLFD